jgi:hypothetical protein
MYLPPKMSIHAYLVIKTGAAVSKNKLLINEE